MHQGVFAYAAKSTDPTAPTPQTPTHPRTTHLPCPLVARLSQLYAYNAPTNYTFDFSSWAAFTASALAVSAGLYTGVTCVCCCVPSDAHP